MSSQTNSLDEQKRNDKIDDDERLSRETLYDYQGGNDLKLKLDDNRRNKLQYYLDQRGNEMSTDNQGGNEEFNYNPGGNEKLNDNPGGNEKLNDNPEGNEKSNHNPGVNEKSNNNPGGNEKSSNNPVGNEKKFNDNRGLNEKKSNNNQGGGEKIYDGNPEGNEKCNDNPGGNEHSNDNPGENEHSKGNPGENGMSHDNQEGNEESKDNLGRNDIQEENEEKPNDNQERNKEKSNEDRKKSKKKSKSDQERNENSEDNQLGKEDKSNDDDHVGNGENCNDKQKRNEKKSDDYRQGNEKKSNDNEGRSKKLGNDKDTSKDDRGGREKMSSDRENTILKKPVSEKIPKKSENAQSIPPPPNILSKKVKSRKPENNKPNISENKKATTEEKVPLVIPVNIEDGNTAVAVKSFEDMFREAVADIAAYKKRSESRVLGGFASNPNNLLEEAKFLKFLVDAFRNEFNEYEMILEGGIEAMNYSGEYMRCLQAATTFGISKNAMKTITGLVKQLKICFGEIDEAIFDCLRQPVINLDEYFAKKENVIPTENIKKLKSSSWVIDCYSQKKPLHSRTFIYKNLLFEFSLQELRIYENHLLPNFFSYSERCTFTGVFFVLKFIDGRESELFIDTSGNSLYCWQLGMLCSGESSGSFEGGRGCVDSKNIIIKTYIDGGRERADDFMYGIPDVDEVVKNIPVGSVISERQFGKEIELTVNRTPKKDKICHRFGMVSRLTNLSKFPLGNFVITNCGVMLQENPITP